MKTKSTSRSAFFNLRGLTAGFFCPAGVAVVLFGTGAFSSTFAQTPTPTPTPCPWSAGPDMPTPLIRAVGVFFPADRNFYTIGGRSSDAVGSDFQHVLRYSPRTNTWTQMGVTLPDNQVNNMACGVLNKSGTDVIYCVGGSAATQTTATAR